MHHFAALPQRLENQASLPSGRVAATDTAWPRNASTKTGRALATPGELATTLPSTHSAIPASASHVAPCMFPADQTSRVLSASARPGCEATAMASSRASVMSSAS